MDAFRRLNMQSTTTKNSPASSIFQIILTSKVVAIFLAILMVGTLLFSIYMDERSVGLLRQETAAATIQRHPLDVYEVDTCPMYIFPYGHPFSNLKHVHLDDVPYFPQFAWVDITDNQIYLQCDGEISILGPDSSQFRTPQNKVRYTTVMLIRLTYQFFYSGFILDGHNWKHPKNRPPILL